MRRRYVVYIYIYIKSANIYKERENTKQRRKGLPCRNCAARWFETVRRTVRLFQLFGPPDWNCAPDCATVPTVWTARLELCPGLCNCSNCLDRRNGTVR
eukprot:185158-Pyramimonas_sp.AAC.2